MGDPSASLDDDVALGGVDQFKALGGDEGAKFFMALTDPLAAQLDDLPIGQLRVLEAPTHSGASLQNHHRVPCGCEFFGGRQSGEACADNDAVVHASPCNSAGRPNRGVRPQPTNRGASIVPGHPDALRVDPVRYPGSPFLSWRTRIGVERRG